MVRTGAIHCALSDAGAVWQGAMNCARTNVYAYRIYLDTSMRIVDQSGYVQSYARTNVTGSQARRNKLRPYACLPGDDECAFCPRQRS